MNQISAFEEFRNSTNNHLPADNKEITSEAPFINLFSFQSVDTQNSLLQSVLDNSPVITYIKDQSGRLHYVNHAFIDFARRAEKEIIGKTCEELFPDTQFEKLIACDMKAIMLKQTVKSEDVIFTEQGERKFESAKMPLAIPNSNEVFILGYCIDKTCADLNTQKLDSFVALYSQMMENANVIFIGMDKNGKILVFNKAVSNITGYTREEVIGKNWSEFFHRVHLVSNNIKSTNNEDENRFSQSTKPIVTKAGEERIISWQNTIYTTSEIDELFIASFGSDITEQYKSKIKLNKSEEKYKNLFEDDLTGDFIADSNGNIIDVNQSFSEIYNFTNRKDVIGMSYSTFLPNPTEIHSLLSRLKKEKKLVNYDIIRKAIDGKYYVSC